MVATSHVFFRKKIYIIIIILRYLKTRGMLFTFIPRKKKLCSYLNRFGRSFPWNPKALLCHKWHYNPLSCSSWTIHRNLHPPQHGKTHGRRGGRGIKGGCGKIMALGLDGNWMIHPVFILKSLSNLHPPKFTKDVTTWEVS